MAVKDWSEDPAKNTSIDGVAIGEGCDAGNVNDGLRRIMAAVATFAKSIAQVAAMPLTGGVFTGQIRRQGRGGYLHNATADSAGGAVYVITAGSKLPTGLQNGDIVVEIA